MIVRAHAKFNYSLTVLGRQADGYHALDMLNASLDLCDEMLISPARALTLNAGEDNLVMRAARLLDSEAGGGHGAAIYLEKRIPERAGLGGGSADCAAALAALNAFWGLGYSLKRLAEIGLRLGADVPFCLYGGVARVRGRGELVERLPFVERELLLVMPERGLSTRDVFAEYDRQNAAIAARAPFEGDWSDIEAGARNDLTAAASVLNPRVDEALSEMRRLGARFAAMSGSGASVAAEFASEEALARAREEMAGKYPFCREARTWPRGVEVFD